jgi:RNA methyltransferase, TrmH family
MITSRDNAQLKQIHKLHSKKGRDSSGLFVAEGEDLVTTAEQSGWTPEIHLRADEDVEPELLARVSSLGSGTRVIGVYRQRWSEPRGDVCVYLHGVGDPGNVGTIVRAAHALCDGPVILGAGCADPFGPKAVRASMGSIFARPPAKAELSSLAGLKLGLDSGADRTLLEATHDAVAPIVLCVGGEREGFPDEVVACLDAIARIPQRLDGPDSLNVAMAASIGLYELGNRMAHHA